MTQSIVNAIKIVVYVLVCVSLTQPVDADDFPWYALGDGIHVRPLANKQTDTLVPLNIVLDDALESVPFPDKPVRAGKLVLSYDRVSHELRVVHQGGAQWIGKVSRLKAFGRAQAPGIEIAWRASEREAIYGLGERFDALNLAGRKVDMWIVDQAGQGDGSATYFTAPVLYSSAGYGLYADKNPDGLFDLDSSGDGWHRYRRAGNTCCLNIVFGPDVPSMIRTRAQDRFPAGARPAPSWAYAPWMSKNSYETQAEAEAAMDKMRALDLPFGVIVLEAWKGPSETGEFNRFDKTRWPDPTGFLDRCKREGVKVVLWQVPILHPSSPWFEKAKAKGYLVRDASGAVSLREQWLAGFGNIDFYNPDAVRFYKDMLRPVVRMGISGFKADDGEAIKPTDRLGRQMDVPGWRAHNDYSTAYNIATYELFREEGIDGMLWARSGSLGIEMAPGLWAGDQGAEWSQLRRLVTAGLSSSISGMPFWGHDIGGYFGHCTPELYIRWLQFGTLSPFMQFHGVEPREPWHFGEDAIEAYRLLTGLRAKIRPTLESLGQEAADTGMPIMRPMFFVTGRHDGPVVPDQYMLGNDMLVAPVMHEGATGRIVRFPEGRWRHALSTMVFEGPGEYSVPIGLVDAPLFVREGSTVAEAVFEYASAHEQPTLLNVRAPLAGKPKGEPVVLRFASPGGEDIDFQARWYFTDAKDDVHEAPVRVSPGGEILADLTPADIGSALGRRQVYELFEGTAKPDKSLLRGEVNWRDLLRVDVDNPYLDVVTEGPTTITGQVTNRTDTAREVELRLVLPEHIKADAITKRLKVGPGESASFDWPVEVQADPGAVGDARVKVEACIDGIPYGGGEAALIHSPAWLVAGPYPAASKAQAFAATSPAEWSFGPEAGFKTPNGLLRWEAVDPKRVAEMNGLDFNALFGHHDNAFVYATALIRSDRDQPVQMRVGTDDTLSLWVNGELLIAKTYDRAAMPDQDIIDARFKRGVNRVLIKVAQGQFGWAMVARITDPDGNPVTGLTDALADAGAYDKDRPERGIVVSNGLSLDLRCIGPFAYDAGKDVIGRPAIEDAIEHKRPLPDRVAGLTWRPLKGDDDLGYHDLKPLTQDHNVFVYCTTHFELDKPTEVELRCGSDDGLVVWVDGERVIDAEKPRAFVPNEDVARVKLGKGPHRLVARVSQGTGDWGFDVRLWDVSREPAVPLGAGD